MVDFANRTDEPIARHHSEPRDSQHTCHLETGLREVLVVWANDLVKIRHGVLDLGRNHGDQPFVMTTRKRGDEQDIV